MVSLQDGGFLNFYRKESFPIHLRHTAMSERTGLSISQVTDEVLYTGLVEMQELEELDD